MLATTMTYNSSSPANIQLPNFLEELFMSLSMIKKPGSSLNYLQIWVINTEFLASLVQILYVTRQVLQSQ
jgi:hypothetical protein